MRRRRPLRILACLTACLAAPIAGAASAFSACPAPEGPAARLVELDERLEAVLDTGTRVRFWGAEVPLVEGQAPASGREKLLAWLSAVPLTLRLLATAPDRWGRIEAHVYGPRPRRAPLSVAEALVDAGLARVRPDPGDRACLLHLWRLEDGALREKIGLWADPDLRPLAALDRARLKAQAGRWAIVRGRVQSVNESGFATYLNFGPIRTVDFAVTVRRTVAKEVEAALGPLAALAGRDVEVRGFLDLRFGPQVDLGRAEAIRLLDAPVSQLPYSGRETRR